MDNMELLALALALALTMTLTCKLGSTKHPPTGCVLDFFAECVRLEKHLRGEEG